MAEDHIDNGMTESWYEIDYVSFSAKDPGCGLGTVYLPPGSTTYWEKPKQYKSITLGPGAELNILNTEVEIDPGGMILLNDGSKLRLSNSEINSCIGSLKPWYGIYSNGGRVVLEDNSSIRNAEYGITMNRVYNDDYPPDPVVIIEKSSITNCKVGLWLEGGSQAYVRDESSISNCSTGVDLKFGAALQVQDTYFKDNDISIEADGGVVDVREVNEFENGYSGIILTNTHPFEQDASLVGYRRHTYDYTANSFTDVRKGVNIAGVVQTIPLDIKNNKFVRCDGKGVVIYGETNGDIEQNYFEENLTAAQVTDAGSDMNEMLCNNHRHNKWSTNYNGLNDNSIALGNKYSNNKGTPQNPQGPHISVFGDVFPRFRSGSNRAAGNEFLDPIIPFEVTGSSELVEYTYYEDAPSEDPGTPTLGGDWFKTSTRNQYPGCKDGLGPDEGLTGGGGGGGNSNDDDDDPSDDPDPTDNYTIIVVTDTIYNDACIKCITDSIAVLTEILVDTGGDDPSTCAIEGDTSYVRPVEKRLHDWIYYGVEVAIKTENDSLGDAILGDLCPWHWQKRYIGYKMRIGKYTEATNLLLSISFGSSDDDILDKTIFREVQLINIKYITEGEQALTKSEIDYLFSSAHEETPSAGYALGLYRRITDHQYWPEVNPPVLNPPLQTNSAEPTSAVESLEMISIHPNPFTDALEITLPIMESEIVLSLSNSTGVEVSSVTIPAMTDSYRLDGATLTNGVYYLTASTSDGAVVTRKVIKL